MWEFSNFFLLIQIVAIYAGSLGGGHRIRDLALGVATLESAVLYIALRYFGIGLTDIPEALSNGWAWLLSRLRKTEDG